MSPGRGRRPGDPYPFGSAPGRSKGSWRTRIIFLLVVAAVAIYALIQFDLI